MSSEEVQIYPPSREREKPQFFSWANLLWTILTGVIALATAWTTVQINLHATQTELSNFKDWAKEQKEERNEKIDRTAKASSDGLAEIKRDYVRRDEMRQQTETLNIIREDTRYLRQRVDDLEIRKKNN